ncbi:hypothetical protein RQP46_001525 [Phenoliferia psychrophenolica]
MITPPSLSPAKVAFLNNFYEVSDQSDPAAVDRYLAFLTKDVKFTMGLVSMEGHDAVRKMRESMWGGVATRKHTPERVYPANEAGDELMLYGTVNGVGWAGRIVFEEAEGELKMSSYQVWLDSSPLVTALKEA